MHIYRQPSRELLCSLPKLPFFYIIQHKTSKLYYAGSKYARAQSLKRETNLATFMTNDGYITSSKSIQQIIKHEGCDSFMIKKIVLFNSIEQTRAYEAKFLQRVNAAANKSWLNKSNSGGNGSYIRKKGIKGKPHTEETKRRISEKAIGRKLKPLSQQHKDKLSKLNKGKKLKKPRSIEYCKKMSNTCAANMTIEKRLKIAQSLLGKKRSRESVLKGLDTVKQNRRLAYNATIESLGYIYSMLIVYAPKYAKSN